MLRRCLSYFSQVGEKDEKGGLASVSCQLVDGHILIYMLQGGRRRRGSSVAIGQAVCSGSFHGIELTSLIF